MRLIEALKKIKYLQRKLSDLRLKIAQHCADMDCDTPVYQDQHKQMKEWLQMYCDTSKFLGEMRYRINKTNIETTVPVEIAGGVVKKSIAEWIVRRRELIDLERRMYESLTDNRLPAQDARRVNTTGEIIIAHIRRYYNPEERDQKLALLAEEPSLIDSALEIANATTDLVE